MLVSLLVTASSDTETDIPDTDTDTDSILTPGTLLLSSGSGGSVAVPVSVTGMRYHRYQ